MQNLITYLAILLSVTFTQAYSQSPPNPHFEADFFTQQRFAHRGGHATGPENTLKTILYNLESGVNAIEIDVRLTEDHQLIVFHDETIERILQSDAPLKVSELTLEEIQAIPLRDKSQGTQFAISLSELTDTLATFLPEKGIGDFMMEIDFKLYGNRTEKGVDVLLNLLEQQGEDVYNHVFVSSFYPGVLKALNENNPKVVTAFAINNNASPGKWKARIGVLMAPMIIKRYQVDIIEPNLDLVSKRFVRKWTKKNILINAYTANTQAEKDHLSQFKIAFTTKCPTGDCDQDPNDESIEGFAFDL